MSAAQPTDRQREGEPSVRAAILRFALAGLVAVALVGLLSFFLMRSIGTDQATENASEITRVIGEGVVEPQLTPALLAGDPAAIERFDRLIRTDVLSDQIVRVKLWDEDGRIVYSDEPRLIGQKFELGGDERDALRTGSPDAELSDVSEPENRYERPFGELLEAYSRIRAPNGEPLLFETYTRYSDVTSSGRDLWLAFLPALILSLLLLELIQLPLASSLAKRVRAAHRDRVRLLERAVDASDRERRRIAGDLHDGAVQDLTGVALALEVGARRVEGDDPGSAQELRSGAARTRASVRSLRSLLVEIYPPSLQRAGLAAALEDMLAPLEARGIATSLDFDPAAGLDVEREALCFRVAQEAVRNALKHSGADRVAVSLRRSDDGVELSVSDDGRGFDPTAGGEEGHIGTDLLRDLAAEAGGTINVDSAPGRGAVVALSLPPG
ncbi:MAG: sensor histidine kinase [Solirubrobacterales bacterium]